MSDGYSMIGALVVIGGVAFLYIRFYIAVIRIEKNTKRSTEAQQQIVAIEQARDVRAQTERMIRDAERSAQMLTVRAQ